MSETALNDQEIPAYRKLWNEEKDVVGTEEPEVEINQERFPSGCQWLTPVILDQEDHSLKPTWANSLEDPISKNPSQK
jgi:acyl carrier protein phosphodiesterase